PSGRTGRTGLLGRRHVTPCARLGGGAGVLLPYPPGADAPVTTDRDHQRGRTPPERLVSQPPDDGVPHTPPPAAAAPPVARVSVDDLAGQDRPVRLDPLPR